MHSIYFCILELSYMSGWWDIFLDGDLCLFFDDGEEINDTKSECNRSCWEKQTRRIGQRRRGDVYCSKGKGFKCTYKKLVRTDR